MKKTIKDFSLDFKTVILRCDLNVTIKDNKIVDDTRIKESLETIKYILDNNAKVVILSHLGKVKTLEDKEKNNLKLIEKEKNLVKKMITDKEIIDVDAVFVYNGYEPKTDFVKGIKLKNGYIIVNKNMQSSNKDIYACGDIILKDIYQITTAVSEATIAAINVKKELS